MSIFIENILMEELKKCTKCFIEKPKTDFFKDRQKKTGYSPHCKKCDKIISKNWSKGNPEQRKYNVLKSSTGVTKEQYLELLNEQNLKCMICGKTEEENNRRLSVDHCHKEKLVRGLLCTKCNFGLGYFNDSQELLNKAIYYLHNNFKNKKIKYK